MLPLHSQVDWFFLCLLLRLGLVVIAPRILFIDYLVKTFNFAKKEASGPEKKNRYFCSSQIQHCH